VSGLEVVVLEQFLVLEVAILGLDGVELVSKGKVVLVSLLDLEDLCLQLRDEQIFLVRCQMDAVVVPGHFTFTLVTGSSLFVEVDKKQIKFNL
jgi:hypothetical protein